MARTAKTGGRTATALPADLIKLANRLASLQRRRRDQMRKLREITGEMRTIRRQIKALAQSMERDPYDQLPSFRTLGES